MGAGQISGFATLIDIDFHNGAEFIGRKAEVTEGQHVVYYMSHALLFCLGTLIEAHVVLTPASCVAGERYKFDVIAGTHRFQEHTGVQRQVQHLCVHKQYNHSSRWISQCTNNLALMILDKQFSFNMREQGAEFAINRVRYAPYPTHLKIDEDLTCTYFGFGSRRNSFLVPLLLDLMKVTTVLLPQDKCTSVYHSDNRYLCVQSASCRNEKYGSLCPDDVGSVLVCRGFLFGMMTSHLLDRPCGTGFLDMSMNNKFFRCGVDDSRDVIIEHDDMSIYSDAFKLHSTTPRIFTGESTELSE